MAGWSVRLSLNPVKPRGQIVLPYPLISFMVYWAYIDFLHEFQNIIKRITSSTWALYLI